MSRSSAPVGLPETGQIEEFREPIARISFLLPTENIGALMQLCAERRATYIRTEYLSSTRAILKRSQALQRITGNVDAMLNQNRGSPVYWISNLTTPIQK